MAYEDASLLAKESGGNLAAIKTKADNLPADPAREGGNLASIKTNTDKIPAQGQALAAGCMPVVLPAAQISTLTPPAAITNFANETGGNLATIAGAVSGGHVQADIVGALPAGTANIGDVDIASIAAGDNNIGNVDIVTLPAGSSGKSTDFDTGAGTDNVASYGIAFPASGGAVICPGDATNGMKVQALLNAETTKVIGTVRVASGGIASGAIASGAIASGALASGSIASGAAVDGAIVTLGAKTDAKSTATDGTAVSAMQVLKQISASVQAPPSQAVTNADITTIAGAVSGGHMQSDIVGALPAGTNTIGNVGHGKTIKTASGSLTADTDVIAAVTSKRIKVIAYSLISAGTNANTLIFKSNGAAGTELWRVPLQSVANVNAGANLSIAAPSFLFATAAGEKLTIDVNQTDTVHYSITYFDDDAT